jgi:hypothetical protein
MLTTYPAGLGCYEAEACCFFGLSKLFLFNGTYALKVLAAN